MLMDICAISVSGYYEKTRAYHQRGELKDQNQAMVTIYLSSQKLMFNLQ